MNSVYRNNLEAYLSAMIQVKRMQAIGIITLTEHAKIDTIMASKYGLSSCSIWINVNKVDKKLERKE